MLETIVHKEKPRQQPDSERYARLRARLLDEMGRGATLRRMARELVDYGLHFSFYAHDEATARVLHPLDEGVLKEWVSDPTKQRNIQRYSNVPSQADKIENALELYFADLDAERTAKNRYAPDRVRTSVLLKGVESIQLARSQQKPVHIMSVPGAGKTEFMNEYQDRSRKAEGLDCPVWAIGLDEWCLSGKAILSLLAEQVCPGSDLRKTEFEIVRDIENAIEDRGGVLIIDEANFLMDIPGDAGIRIINSLRRFCDRGMMGIAFLDNGEMYRKLDPKKKRPQLTSRFDAWRVDIPPPNEEDIELVMYAWGVSGREERKLCLELGSKPGTLRTLTDRFRKALEFFGEINHATMDAVGGVR